MAENTDDDLTNCSVCFELYAENGDHVPRILPCFHTLCEKCIKQLFRGRTLTCPECRNTHCADNVKKFHQNKYVLTHIRRKRKEQEEKEASLKGVMTCKKHNGKEACFYCKDPSCQKAICPVCLLDDHRLHEVVDVHQERKQRGSKLLSEVKTLFNHLQRSQQMVVKMKGETNQDYAAFVESVKSKKNEYIKIIENSFGQMLNDASEKIEEVNRNIDEELEQIDEQLIIMESMKERLDEGEITHEEITDMRETFQFVETQVDSNIAIVKSYKCPEFNDTNATDDDIKRLCGFLTEKEILLNLMQPTITDTTVKTDLITKSWKVTQLMTTSYENVGCLSALGKDCVITCGEENGQWRLNQYNLRSGTTLEGPLSKGVELASVLYNGEKCLALSDGEILEFREVENLDQVLKCFVIEGSELTYMCASSRDTLIIDDVSEYPSVAFGVDCTGPDIFYTDTNIQINTFTTSMCCVEYDNQELLITPYHKEGLFDGKDESGICAYNTRTGKLLWNADGVIPGVDKRMVPSDVATDGCGHLFVCDTNNTCLQMFSTDGNFLEAFDLDVLKAKNKGVATPHRICWSSGTSSLVVAFENNKKHFIAVIKVGESSSEKHE